MKYEEILSFIGYKKTNELSPVAESDDSIISVDRIYPKENFKKPKLQQSNNNLKDQDDYLSDFEIESVTDFEFPAIHDEQLDLHELKKKYRY